jgi:predicted transposase YbfD/YdcC
MMHALLAGLLSNAPSLREVEALSARLGLGRRGGKVSDTALGKLIELLNPDALLAVLVAQVRDMRRRGELAPDGLPCGVVTIDGKCLGKLGHHAGGRGHPRVSADGARAWWELYVIRAVLVSAAGRPALLQWTRAPGESEVSSFTSVFRRLVEHFGDGELFRIVDVDAGYCSRENFATVDAAGYGVVMALKGNQPELHEMARRALGRQSTQRAAEQSTPWQCQNGHRIRRELWRTTLPAPPEGWRNLRQVWLIRQTTTDAHGCVLGVEDRYFITNVLHNYLKSSAILELVRRHWAVENDCFKSLDVQWREDARPWWSEGNALLSLGILRLLAYNLAQRLRKRHLTVATAGRREPLPWRPLYELLREALLVLGRDLERSPRCVWTTAPPGRTAA